MISLVFDLSNWKKDLPFMEIEKAARRASLRTWEQTQSSVLSTLNLKCLLGTPKLRYVLGSWICESERERERSKLEV